MLEIYNFATIFRTELQIMLLTFWEAGRELNYHLGHILSGFWYVESHALNVVVFRGLFGSISPMFHVK